MTPGEWISKLRALPQMVRDSRVLFFGTKATMIQVSERVWGKGLLTNGSKLTYKNYELYAYKPPSPVKPSGKGKTGKKIKGGYYANYEAYKAQQGRADLPFELTGDMRKAWLGGGVGEPTEKGPLNVVIQVDDVSAKKIAGLTKEKGEFLKFTDAEVQAQVSNIEAAYKELVLDKL